MGQVSIIGGRGKKKVVVGYAQVDDDLLIALSLHSWSFTHDGYAKTNEKVEGKWTTIHLHQMVWRLKKGPLPVPPMRLDHKDRDKLNCVVENLREVTHSQNKANNKVKGVYKSVRGRCVGYTAVVTRDGKSYAKFFREEAAALAWRATKKDEIYPELN